MTHTTSPLEALRPPAADADPEVRLGFLAALTFALGEAGGPRLAELGRRLAEALRALAAGHARGEEARVLGRRAAAEVRDLELEAYDLLSVVVNQVRATLRVRVEGGLRPAGEVRVDRLQEGLAEVSKGLRKLLGAARRGDVEAERQGATEVHDGLALVAGAGLPPLD
jgi:hypothetical protein